VEKHTVFYSESLRLDGDLYLSSDLKAGERRPGIVLCHGFRGLRALILGDYAKVLSSRAIWPGASVSLPWMLDSNNARVAGEPPPL
jgi:hypothetical protein